MKQIKTCIDCLISGTQISIKDWKLVSQPQFISLTSDFAPQGEFVSDFHWTMTHLNIDDLRESSEDGDEPEGGWKKLYKQMLLTDACAVKSGSLERIGRDAWIKKWTKNTEIYPLYIVQDAPGVYRLWDGHHRLAGAFAYGLECVAVVLGVLHNIE